MSALLATERGGLSTTAEIQDWLLNAGFAPPETVSLPAWAASTLIIAEKPGLSPA